MGDHCPAGPLSSAIAVLDVISTPRLNDRRAAHCVSEADPRYHGAWSIGRGKKQSVFDMICAKYEIHGPVDASIKDNNFLR